ARRKAEQSRIAAEQAEKAAAARNATQAEKDNATKLRATATADEADAEKKESASEVANADKTLKQSKLDDLNAGRQANNPSAATVKAQAEYDAASKTDAIVNEQAGDPHSPLAEAQADTAAKLKAAKAASKAVEDAKAQGKKPTAEQLAAEKQTQADWSDAIEHQLRVAGADATSHGKDPDAAMDAQVDQILKDVRKDGYFDADSLQSNLAPAVKQLKSESPQQRDLMLEYESVQADGQKQVADAKAQAADLDGKAKQAEAAAKQPVVMGPYVPATTTNASATTNPNGSNNNTVVVPYAPTFTTTGTNGVTGITGTNSTFNSPPLFGTQANTQPIIQPNTPQFRATQARADANAAQSKLDTLEAAFGHTDPSDPSKNTIGTVQADFNKRGADIGAADARNHYLKVLSDPGSTPQQTAAAYDAWQAAVDQQTLMTQMQTAINADATLLQAQQAQAQAQADYDQTRTRQPYLISTLSGDGLSGSLAPDGRDPTLNVDYRNAGDRKNVELVNGKYMLKVAESDGQTLLQPLSPVAARLWDTNVKLEAARNADKTANTNLQQTWLDQHGGPDGTGLDVSGWLKKADQYSKDLTDANGKVSTAQQDLTSAQNSHQPDDVLQKDRIALGAALQQQSLAQARVDAVNAMQTLRNAQMAGGPDGQPPSNLSALSDSVRSAVKKVNDLPGAQLMTPDDEATRRNKTLPDERNALSALDVKLQAAKSAADMAPNDAAAEKTYRDYANQYDWLSHKIDVQQAEVDYADAQRAGLAASYEYKNTQRPGGVDLHTRTHSAADDSALTWGITPGQNGQSVLNGLPSNIKPQDVHVQKKDGVWTVTFDKDAGAYAARTTAAGRAGAYTSYVDGSNKDDIAIEKGHAYTLNADAARYWEAANTDSSVGASTLVNAKAAYDQAQDVAQLDPVTDGTGKPVLTNGQLSTSQPATGPDGKPVTTIDFNVDQTANKASADAKVLATANALTKAQDALNAGNGDPAKLKAAVTAATADHDLALSEQTAVGAVLDWQIANHARQDDEAGWRLGVPQFTTYGQSSQEKADDLLANAQYQVAQWQSTRQKVEVGRAQTAVNDAQAAYNQYLSVRPYLSAASAADSTEGRNLQAAKVQLEAANRTLAAAAVPTANTQQKAFVAANLAPGGEDDPHAMYELFMKNPGVMAQGLINSDYAQNGGLPTEMHNRTELRNTVALALGYTPSMTLDPTDGAAYAQTLQTQDLFGNLDSTRSELLDKTVDQIVSVGGEHAKVTTLPVVYAIDGDKDKGGGIVKTAVFKVENQDGNGTHLVDEYGERYDDVDDYRANNNLPVDGVNLAMPKDGNFTLDSNGNVELFTGDARTETDWQHFRRKTHLDAIVGGLAIVGGVLLEFGSAGTLTPVAGALILGGASLYGVTTAAQSLSNRADHGLSINPFTDREAGMDWLNLGASALALPSLGSAGRAATMMFEAERAAAGSAKLMTTTTSTFASLTGKGAMYTGAAAMADGGAYMVQNWDKMSDADRWEQGGMFLLNLASFGTHPAAEAFKQRAAAKVDGATQPVVDTVTGGAKTNADGTPAVETVADTTTTTGGVHTLDTEGAGTQPLVTGDGALPLLTVADPHGAPVDATDPGAPITTADTGSAQDPVALDLPSPHENTRDPAPVDLLSSSSTGDDPIGSSGDPTLAAASGARRYGRRGARDDMAHEQRVLDRRQAERTSQRKQAAASPLARAHANERKVLVQGEVGKAMPGMAPKSEGLGTHATMAELLDSGALPGSEGITLTGRFSYGELYRLSTLNGRRVEFALTFENVGGQRVRRLYSGSEAAVDIPDGARPVAHTHPTPHENQRVASDGDIALLGRLHDEAMVHNPGAAPRPHFIVWGEKSGPQGDYTAVYPTEFRRAGDDTTTMAAGRSNTLHDHEGLPAFDTPEVDATGYKVQRNSLSDTELARTLDLVHDAGGRLDGVSYVVYPAIAHPETGAGAFAPRDGLQGIVRADARAAGAVEPSRTTAVAYRTLDEALGATRGEIEEGELYSFGDHVALVSNSHLDAQGNVASDGVIGEWTFDGHGDAAQSKGVRLNPQHAGDIRVAWPDGYTPGAKPLDANGVDHLNAAPGRTTLALNQFRPRFADMALFAPGRVRVTDDGAPVRQLIPVPEGHYALEMHGADTGRWVQGPDGRALNAAEV
ncbi:MAG TPA: DUF4781 domain-containing protein, partial [Burkholderiaceae bacterium]|nr:DUF4781 domain-containing protein [Burkholderiaceae bacterium]